MVPLKMRPCSPLYMPFDFHESITVRLPTRDDPGPCQLRNNAAGTFLTTASRCRSENEVWWAGQSPLS